MNLDVPTAKTCYKKSKNYFYPISPLSREKNICGDCSVCKKSRIKRLQLAT